MRVTFKFFKYLLTSMLQIAMLHQETCFFHTSIITLHLEYFINL